VVLLRFGSVSLTTPVASFDQLDGAAAYAACDAIVAVDEQQRIVMFNPAAQRMFGYSAGEVLGRSSLRCCATWTSNRACSSRSTC